MSDNLLTLESNSPEKTRLISCAIASISEQGDFILLEGELGAGKTLFVKGFAQCRGYEGIVTSPTFALVQEYPSEPVLLHADLYRLDSIMEFEQLGLEELASLNKAITLIEWAEIAKPALRSEYLEIVIEVDESDIRYFHLKSSAPSWVQRLSSIDLTPFPGKSSVGSED